MCVQNKTEHEKQYRLYCVGSSVAVLYIDPHRRTESQNSSASAAAVLTVPFKSVSGELYNLMEV